MILALLLESALRTLVLAAAVGLVLALLRVNDTRTQTAAWSLVLCAALAMPLVSRLLPGGWTFHLPALWTAPAAQPILARGAEWTGASASGETFLSWLRTHAILLAWSFYCLVALVCLARLAVGLILMLRLYRRATPVEAHWARGRIIRASTALQSPISFANAILLPADHDGWSDTKRAAVLAHEQAHVARGDFFLQLLAMVHRALFWFSPFAWWLQYHLAELAETASDRAAAQALNDPAAYAEILIDVSRQAHFPHAVIAMAKGPGIAQRIERVLSETPERKPSRMLRLMLGAGLAPLAVAVAGAHAAIAPPPSFSAPVARLATERVILPSAGQRTHIGFAGVEQIATQTSAANGASDTGAAAPSSRVRRTAPRRAAAKAAPVPHPADHQAVSYNPRALLEDPQAAILPALVPTNTARGKNGAAAAILLNLNEPGGN
jgi:beta-lactamase regulating signal transducer with metallopeptidase domain